MLQACEQYMASRRVVLKRSPHLLQVKGIVFSLGPSEPPQPRFRMITPASVRSSCHERSAFSPAYTLIDVSKTLTGGSFPRSSKSFRNPPSRGFTALPFLVRLKWMHSRLSLGSEVAPM